MSEWTIRNLMSSLATAIVFLIAPIPAMAADASDGTIALEIYKAGFIIGGAGGSGTLTYKGTAHAIEIAGVSLGATIGVSKADLIGEVYNLKSLEDIEGTYTATTVGLAVAGGDKTAQLKNAKGVELKIKGKQIGFELSLDLSGLELKLKR